jgi:hypothetical protein
MLGRSLSAAQLPPTGPRAEQPVARSPVSFLPPSRRSARDARPPARMDHSTAARPARAPGPSCPCSTGARCLRSTAGYSSGRLDGGTQEPIVSMNQGSPGARQKPDCVTRRRRGETRSLQPFVFCAESSGAAVRGTYSEGSTKLPRPAVLARWVRRKPLRLSA